MATCDMLHFPEDDLMRVYIVIITMVQKEADSEYYVCVPMMAPLLGVDFHGVDGYRKGRAS